MTILKLFACFVAPAIIILAIYTPISDFSKACAAISTVGLAGMALTSDDN